jgi:hypothetical protein
LRDEAEQFMKKLEASGDADGLVVEGRELLREIDRALQRKRLRFAGASAVLALTLVLFWQQRLHVDAYEPTLDAGMGAPIRDALSAPRDAARLEDAAAASRYDASVIHDAQSTIPALHDAHRLQHDAGTGSASETPHVACTTDRFTIQASEVRWTNAFRLICKSSVVGALDLNVQANVYLDERDRPDMWAEIWLQSADTPCAALGDVTNCAKVIAKRGQPWSVALQTRATTDANGRFELFFWAYRCQGARNGACSVEDVRVSAF